MSVRGDDGPGAAAGLGGIDATGLSLLLNRIPPVGIKHESSDPTNADEALLILGIATRNPDRQEYKADRERLLLEPWAVQAALSQRRGGSKLTEQEIEEIQRCTRDAATLGWPRGAAE